MTRREFAAMVLKLLGVFAVLQALPHIQTVGLYVGMLADMNSGWPVGIALLVGALVPFLLMGAAGVFLLAKSRWLARRMFREDAELGMGTGLDASDVQTVVFSAVGLLLFLDAVPRLLQVVAGVSAPIPSTLGTVFGRQYVHSVMMAALAIATQAGIGLSLFFRARGLSNLWRRLQAGRYVRIEEARNADAEPDRPEE